jgi:3-phosphoshikimate 1-carboxyvinyltransferase
MRLHCDINLPASKSESNRALMIAAYGGFVLDIEKLSDSKDTLVLAKALRQIRQNKAKIDIADCGTAARFLTTYLACHEGEWLLTGTERMKQRPMTPLVNALRVLGADIQCVDREGYLPLRIQGKPIQGGRVSIEMTQSSQFASSLLLAAPMWTQGLEMDLVGDLSSLPYLEMTLYMMRHFLAQVDVCDRTIKVSSKPYQKQHFTIDGDWSAASYWYEMAAFSEECEIRLRSLKATDLGDSIIAEWMLQLGVGTFVEDDIVILRKIPFEKRSLSFDFSQHPDLYPTMAATCAGLRLNADFTGIDNLALKESDRVGAMQTELAKLGKSPLRFFSHNDHRVVMALAPLSMLFGTVCFDHPEVVEKSYTDFWKDASFLSVCG